MRCIKLLSKNSLFILIITLALVFFFFSFFIEKKDVIFADGAGYFSYPYELFTNGNLNYTSQSSQYNFGVIRTDNFNLNKYPIGTGILLTPALLLGEVANRVVGVNDHSIFNKNYQFFVGLFGIFYFLGGLIVLRKILKRYFSKQSVNLTILAIAFCTNLLIYSSTDASFSHIYSFFAINLFVLYLIKWSHKSSYFNSMLLGFTLGLVLIIRPANIIVLILFLLIPYKNITHHLDLKYNIQTLLSRKKQVATILAVALLSMFPQLLYWWSVTGNLIFYPYIGESFNWQTPQIFNVLFSVNRGALLWHPILLVSIVGVFFLRKSYKFLFWPVLITFVLCIYLISSWWMWDYGIGFGHRAFTDYLGIFAIPLAALIQVTSRTKYSKLLMALLTGLAILNIIHIFNYIHK